MENWLALFVGIGLILFLVRRGGIDMGHCDCDHIFDGLLPENPKGNPKKVDKDMGVFAK